MSDQQSPSPKLPPELISVIVDDLFDDKPALKAFSLVSKAWLRQCQAYIWRSIRITYDLKRTARLVQLLSSSTTLQSCIESCTLDFDLWDDRRFVMGFPFPFAFLKQSLKSIKSVHMCNVHWNGPNIADVLAQSFCLDNVTTLTMKNVLFATTNNIFLILRCLPLLCELHLDCIVNDGQGSTWMQEVPIPPFRVFAYNGTDGSLYQWLVNSKERLLITHLRVTNVLFHQRELVQALLGRLGDQLKHLVIRCRPALPVNLSRLGMYGELL
jgi:hypothetical protein